METIPERCRTPCNASVKFGRGNYSRKSSGSLIPSKTNWPSEISPEEQQPNSNYAGDFLSDHNRKTGDGKSSDDSAVDLNSTEINYGPVSYSTRKLCSSSREKLPCDFRYKILNPAGDPNLVSADLAIPGVPETATDSFASSPGIPQGIIAEERLRKLKELQRRREFTERYYSHEIRKLIADYYRTSGNSGDSVINRQEKPVQSGFYQKQICPVGKTSGSGSLQATSGILKALEPCGTMTTITRLDCGCTQETTRPIFTTSHGRVENRNCRHGGSPALLKLTSSNPREHLPSLNFSNFVENRRFAGLGNNSSCFIKRRPGIDPRIFQTRINSRDIHARDADNDSKRIIQASNSARCDMEIGKGRLRRPETASSSFIRDNNQESRNLSPIRKYSDSNSTD